MMIIMLALFFSWDDPSGWKIEDTGIYQPLRTSEVGVRPNGEVLILNFPEAHITRYNDRGEKMGVIGAKGKGPGEMTYPLDFYLEGENVYVYDVLNGAISIFDVSGKFSKWIRTPSRNLSLVKVADGWVYGNWNDGNSQGKPRIFWVDANFENSREITTLSGRGNRAGVKIEQEGSEMVAEFSPISSSPKMVVTPDGGKVFVSEAETFVIQVIDVARKEVVHTIRRNEKPIPFDEEWGLKKRAEVEGMMAQSEHNFKIKNLFPEYFPAIRDMMIDTSGRLVVDRWRGDPESKHYLIGLDEKGRERKSVQSWEVLSRTIAIQGDRAYVTAFDSEKEEAVLVKLPTSRLDRYVTENPIVYDGARGRRIAIDD